MASNIKKISNLDILTTPTANTKFAVDHASGATVNTYQLSVNNFVNYLANSTITFTATVGVNNFLIVNANTPANSTITVTKGTFLYDTDYLYIAVANNTLKRVPLSSF